VNDVSDCVKTKQGLSAVKFWMKGLEVFVKKMLSEGGRIIRGKWKLLTTQVLLIELIKILLRKILNIRNLNI
jgi:hypothetical protein